MTNNTSSWFPRHINDLDLCSKCKTDYEPTKCAQNAGYNDPKYQSRREEIVAIARSYKQGEAVPRVDYTAEENQTWEAAFMKTAARGDSLMCAEYRKNLDELLHSGVFTSSKIPQLADVNHFLSTRTGFVLRPCAGLLSSRDFLASLAFRVFQATQYVRHASSPQHTPEPDVIHELIGHVPMLVDETLAQLTQEIGLLSLGANDEQIEHLSAVFWFTIEVGLCREEGQLKGIGAALASSYSELEFACSESATHKPFEPATTAMCNYKECNFQPVYFISESLQDALVKVREYAATIEKPFTTVFDHSTKSIQVTGKVEN